MTNKQFWQSASNWGFLGGAALFAANLIGWGLKLEATGSALYELLLFVVLCPLIIVTGRRNAAAAGGTGYPYSRAIGYVFAMMMFAGVVYGVGRFLMVNFIAAEYYAEINSRAIDTALTVYRSTPMYDQVLAMRDTALGWFRNPFYLIFASVVEMVFKGGFLGLVLCAFVVRKPDIFGGGANGQVNGGGETTKGGSAGDGGTGGASNE